MFARRVYQIAGIWGLVVIPLGYLTFITGADPSLWSTLHPEIVHGFFMITLAWQIAFLVIATDPVRYRPLMPVTLVEKFPFAFSVFWMYSQGQVNATMLFMGAIDAALGTLFCIAWLRTGKVIKNPVTSPDLQ